MTTNRHEGTPPDTRQTADLAAVLAHIGTAAQPGVVYGTPITTGAYTIITASEIRIGGGFGSGAKHAHPASDPPQVNPAVPPHTASGIGGGGGSVGRPVAIIIIGPEGVTIKPILDVTTLLLRGVTILGVLLVVLQRVRRAASAR